MDLLPGWIQIALAFGGSALLVGLVTQQAINTVLLRRVLNEKDSHSLAGRVKRHSDQIKDLTSRVDRHDEALILSQWTPEQLKEFATIARGAARVVEQRGVDDDTVRAK